MITGFLWGFDFGHPILLIALVLVPGAVFGWLWLERGRARKAEAWSSPGLLPNMVTGEPGRRRYVTAALFLVGLTLLLVGFARPRATVTVPKEGATVVLAMDVSGSMAAKDVKPSRLAAADAAVTQFLQALPSKYRASLVTFSNVPVVKVPPTYDRQIVINALPTTVELEGTAIGDAVARAATVASRAVGKSRPGSPHPPAAIVLLSDGNQNTGKLKALDGAAQARKDGIPVYTISLGTKSGVVTQKTADGFAKRTHVPAVSSELRAVAKATGARSFTAKTADDLKQVYSDLGSKLAHEQQKREITAWMTMGAIGFILAGAIASGVWFRRPV